MLYTIHFHPALLTLKVRVSWRGWEMQSETLELDEAIRLEKMTADDQPMILETGRKEGSRRVYALERAREYTLEYSVSLFGRLGRGTSCSLIRLPFLFRTYRQEGCRK